MSYYKAISNGNADTLAIWQTWNGAAWVAAGSLPTTTDDVYTNNNIVTVTTSQAYLSWNRSSVAAPLSITQGGQFQIDGGNAITTQGTVNGTNATQVVNVGTSACMHRLSSHINKWSHFGNSIGGSGTNYTYAIFNNSDYEIASIVGNQIGGTGQWSYGFFNNAAATFTSIVGNQVGGIGNLAYGFYNNAASTFTSIVGNQVGNDTNILYPAHGFYNNSTATFTNPITGNQIANTASGFYNNVISINIPFQGNAYASNAAAIYNNQDTTTIIYTGNIYNNLGAMAIRSARLFLNVTPTTVWEFSDFGGNSQYLYGAGSNTGMPPEDKVEDGYIYGANGEFEGTLVQPPFTIADFIAALKADELGIRLGKCATTEEVDSTVASYNT